MPDYSQPTGMLNPLQMVSALSTIQNMNKQTADISANKEAGQAWADQGSDAAVESMQRSGHIDEAIKIQQHIANMNKDQRTALSETNDVLARAALLANSPAKLQSVMSTLKQQGLDTSAYDKLPYDEARASMLAHSKLTTDYISQKNLEEQRAVQEEQFRRQQLFQTAAHNVPYATAGNTVSTYNPITNRFGGDYNPDTGQFGEINTAVPQGVDMTTPIAGAKGSAQPKSSAEEREIAEIRKEHPGMTYTEALKYRSDQTAKRQAGYNMTPILDASGQVVRDPTTNEIMYNHSIAHGSSADVSNRMVAIRARGQDPAAMAALAYAKSEATASGTFDAKTIEARAAVAAPIVDHAEMLKSLLAKPDAPKAVGWLKSHTVFQNLWSEFDSDKYMSPTQSNHDKLTTLSKNIQHIIDDPSAPDIARQMGQLAINIKLEYHRLATSGQGQVPAETRREIDPIVNNIISAPTPAKAIAAVNNLQEMMTKIMLAPTTRMISQSPVIQSGREQSMRNLENAMQGGAIMPRGVPGAPAGAPPTAQTAPPRPATVPAGAAYNSGLQQWRDGAGKLYDATGKPL